jgi:hypothetical protein
MYTIHPLMDANWNSHFGFQVILFLCLVAIAATLVLWKEDEISTPALLFCCFLATMFSVMAHHNSYQPEIKYANVRVIGEFVSYQPEGYNEQSGKSRADHHYMYVVYKIENQMVIFRTEPGQAWPARAVFYRNPVDTRHD